MTECAGDFPYGWVVRLDNLLSGPGTWGQREPGALLPLCDSEQPPPCDVTMAWPRWATVGFGGVDPNISDTIPAEITVDFQVRRGGSGSGTVRSEAIDCGGRCTRDFKFGEPQTLMASPDSGSGSITGGRRAGARRDAASP